MGLKQEKDKLRVEIIETINEKFFLEEEDLLTSIPDACWNKIKTQALISACLRAENEEDQVDCLSNAALNIYLQLKTDEAYEKGKMKGIASSKKSAEGRTKSEDKESLNQEVNIHDKHVLRESARERECREAANEYLNLLLARREDVSGFRANLPGGQIMSPDDAIDFLSLPHCRFFTFRQLQDWDVCPLSSKCEITRIRAISAGAIVEVSNAEFFEQFTYNRSVRPELDFCMSMTTRTGETIEKTTRHSMTEYLALEQGSHPRNNISGLRRHRTLYLRNATNAATGWPIRTVEGFRNSIVGEALVISDKVGQVSEWEPLGALLFLLTGTIMHDRGCKFATPHRLYIGDDREELVVGPMTLTISPWVSPGHVKNLYEIVRESVAARQIPTETNVRIFRFVNQERNKEPEMAWAELYRKWIEQQGAESGVLRRNFKRCYLSAKDALFPPDPALAKIRAEVEELTDEVEALARES